MLKLTFDDYEKWCKGRANKPWKRWEEGKSHISQLSYPTEKQIVTQDEMLELHYQHWLIHPKEIKAQVTESIVDFFEAMEPEYAIACQVLGEDYFD